MQRFLITGATDGVGLQTAKQLAQTAPIVNHHSKRRVIGIHGRSPWKILNAMDQINKHAAANANNFVL